MKRTKMNRWEREGGTCCSFGAIVITRATLSVTHNRKGEDDEQAGEKDAEEEEVEEEVELEEKEEEEEE